MKLNEFLERNPDPKGKLFYHANYDFNISGSDFMFAHQRPTPIEVIGVALSDNWSQIRTRVISAKTGKPTPKTITIVAGRLEIFETEKECVMWYTSQIEKHIKDKKQHIKHQEKRIEVLEGKIIKANQEYLDKLQK